MIGVSRLDITRAGIDRDNVLSRRIREYLNKIIPFMADAIDQAVSSVLTAVSRLPKDTTESEFKRVVIGAVKKSLPDEFETKEFKRAIAEIIEDIYAFYRFVDDSAFLAGPTPKGKIQFTGPDERAIDFLQSVDSFFYSTFIENENFQKPMEKFMREQYLEHGGALFGRGGELQRDALRSAFNNQLGNLTSYQIDRITTSSVQRMRVFGTMESFAANRIVEVQISAIIDGRTSEICQEMDGKRIPVSICVEWIRETTEMSASEYYESHYNSESGKEFNRDPLEYIKGKDIEELCAEGRGFPPYHPFCRTDVIYTG